MLGATDGSQAFLWNEDGTGQNYPIVLPITEPNWVPGGFDGVHHYIVAWDSSGDFPDVINTFALCQLTDDLSTLVNHWTWTEPDDGTYWPPETISRALSIGGGLATLIVRHNAGGGFSTPTDAIVRVMSTADGSLITEWTLTGVGNCAQSAVPSSSMSGDGKTFIFNAYINRFPLSGSDSVIKVDLDTGSWSRLFWIDDVDVRDALDGLPLGEVNGLVLCENGDLIVCGASAVCRYAQSDALVWRTLTPTFVVPGFVTYYGLAATDDGKVWASGTGFDGSLTHNNSDRLVRVDGSFIDAIDWASFGGPNPYASWGYSLEQSSGWLVGALDQKA